MRFRVLACSCLLVAVSAGSVKTLAASPDCARWIKEYQQGLAKRATAAKRHVVRAAQHLQVPHTRLARTAAPPHRLRPVKLSPQEMLRRFRVLCGEDLPEDTVPASFVPTSLEALVVPPVAFPDSTPVTDIGQPVTFTPGNDVPAQPGNTATTTTPPQASGFPGTGFPVGGVGTGGAPVVPNVPIVTPSPVPEPATLVLLLTGAVAMTPVLLRRRHA